jgi:hypothetical protein
MAVGFILYIVPGARAYGTLCFKLAKYYLWPFSKILVSHGSQNLAESEALMHQKDSEESTIYNQKPRACGCSCFAWTVLGCKYRFYSPSLTKKVN